MQASWHSLPVEEVPKQVASLPAGLSTKASKEAAEIVLADDNSISHAVEEGGTVHDNLREALFFILPTSGLQIVRPRSGHFLAGAQHATMQQVK